LVLSSLFSLTIQIVCGFNDEDCLWSEDSATWVDAKKIDMEEENLRLQLEVTRCLSIDDLEEQVWDRQKIVQQSRNDKIQHEINLAFRDAVIEELEASVEENNKKDAAQQDNLKSWRCL
jgi:hypothetical protein